MQHLQPSTTLQGGKYRIEQVLGQGGFGNTYVGKLHIKWQNGLNKGIDHDTSVENDTVNCVMD